MSAEERVESRDKDLRWRLRVAGALWLVGFLPPLFVPAVLAIDFSVAGKALLSTSLVLGVPQLFTLLAIAVAGRRGLGELALRIRDEARRRLPHAHLHLRLHPNAHPVPVPVPARISVAADHAGRPA